MHRSSRRCGKVAGAVVAGGVIERVGAFQIGIAGERLLDIFEVGKADAREALQDGLDRQRRIPVDGQREILQAFRLEVGPFVLQLGKLLFRNILLAAFAEIREKLLEVQLAHVLIR